MGEIMELLSSPIISGGTYTLKGDVSTYKSLISVFGSSPDEYLIADNVVGHSLIPTNLTGYKASASSVHNAWYPTQAFDGTVNSGCWHAAVGVSAGQWIQIRKLEGTIRANMFTFIGVSTGYWPAHLQISGSNNGTTWDILVDDDQSGLKRANTYYLDDYVEYSYYRATYVKGTDTRFCLISQFMIQDKAIVDTLRDVVQVNTDGTGATIGHEDTILAIDGDKLVATNVSTTYPILSIQGSGVSINPPTYRTYERDENGLPKLMLTNPVAIASGLGHDSLQEDLSLFRTMSQVDDILESLNTCAMGGRVDDEASLPSDDVKAGTMYLVGPEGSASYEEFIYTEQGTWERLGSVRQSDVDLSDYTTTEGMNSAISASNVILNGKITDLNATITGAIVGMTTSMTTSIDAASDEVDAVLAGISKEVEVVEDLPAEWPTDIIDEGMLVQVIE